MKFIITHESTDYKQWNYTVEYEEHLSQIPFVINKIIGDFIVDKSHSQPAIKSTHRTCFAKIYCCKYSMRVNTHPRQHTLTPTNMNTHTHSHACTYTYTYPKLRFKYLKKSK